MILASIMEPDLGLFFWTTLVFVLLWILLGKMAWKPITEALRSRESKIEDALHEADKARREMATLKADHERLLVEARDERNRIIKEAKEIKDSVIADAKDKAKAEAAKIVSDAQTIIQNEKMAAITEVKNLLGNATIDLAQEVLKRDLDNEQAQRDFIAKEIEKIDLN